ncbi:MAG: lamin tail domain-containing protein [Candidatus Uhrbacteria bacterium]
MNAHIGRLFLAAGTAATLIAMPLASRAATLSTPTIIVSEIGWAGSSLSTVDEWLELTNLTDDAIDLSGWTVTGAASSGGSLAIPAGKSIPPHSTFLISNYDQSNAKSSLARAPDYVTVSVSLSNAALALGLVDASGTVRDAAGSGSTPLAGRVGGGTASPGIGFASMVRLAPVADGTAATSWETATRSEGFDAGTTDVGTPGVIENWFVPAPVVASESTPMPDATPIVALEPTPATESSLIVETETPPELVSPPDRQEGSGVVVENATMAMADAVPAPTSEPAPASTDPAVTDMPPNAEPDVIVSTTGPMMASTETPLIETAPTIEETVAASDPVEIVAEQPVEIVDIVPETIVEIRVEASLSAAEEIAIPMTTPTPSLNEGGETPEGTSSLSTISNVTTERIETPTIVPSETTPIQMVSITPIVSSFPSRTLLLNEFVSDATAEWIEILNPFNNVIDLSGWTVRDATRKATALPDQLLGLGQFAVVTNPSGKLNNDGDTIELVDPSGSVVDAVAYGTGGETIPKKPNALARNADGAWSVTSALTPGAENRFDAEDATVPSAVAETVEPAPQTSNNSDSNPQPVVDQPTIPTASSTTPMPTIEPAVEPTFVELPGPTTLRLHEIYPNATGDDSAEEFIAIENFGTAVVDLQGWSVTDASGKTFSPSSPMQIEPGATLTLFRATTKIVLNNTSDSVALSAPDGTLIDSISYDSPPIGSILRLQDSKWVWSGNVTGAKPGAVSAGVTATPSAPMAPASSSGGSVSHSRVSGTVLVAPGVLGKQIFYVDDGDGGVQVYKNDADFPDLKEGDVVTITGTTSEAHGEERLKVGKKDSISIVSSAEPEAAEPTSIADISEEDHGRLLRVAGIVLVRSGSHATLEDHGAQIAVRVAEGTGIDASVFAKGTTVEVTGILVAAGGTLTLLPRSPDDISVTQAATPATSAATVPTGRAAQASGDQQAAGVITAGTLLSLLALGGRKLIPAWKLYAKTRALRVAAQAAH